MYYLFRRCPLPPKKNFDWPSIQFTKRKTAAVFSVRPSNFPHDHQKDFLRANLPLISYTTFFLPKKVKIGSGKKLGKKKKKKGKTFLKFFHRPQFFKSNFIFYFFFLPKKKKRERFLGVVRKISKLLYYLFIANKFSKTSFLARFLHKIQNIYLFFKQRSFKNDPSRHTFWKKFSKIFQFFQNFPQNFPLNFIDMAVCVKKFLTSESSNFSPFSCRLVPK